MKTLFFLLLAALPLAGEHVVESKPFEVTLEYEAALLPAKARVFELQAGEWSDFEIKSLVEQGATVKKDEILISFDEESFQEQQESLALQLAQKKLQVAQARQELAELETQTPLKLEMAGRAAVRNGENLAYFKKTGRGLAEEKAKQGLKRSERFLASAEEELKQLLIMYEEDGVTEDTEEIILKNQRDKVESAKSNLHAAKKNTARTLEVILPRQLEDLDQNAEASTRTMESGKSALPRALEIKKEEVAGMSRKLKLLQKKVADMDKDKSLFSIKAPGAGVVYYGEIADGRWEPGKAVKFMKVGSKAPQNEALLTFVPQESALVLEAFVSQENRLTLDKGMKGFFSAKGLPAQAIPITVESAARFPRLDDKYHVRMGAEVPSELVPGMKGQVRLTAYSADSTLAVPLSLVKTKADGTRAVRVKLADGKDEWRPVKLGHSSGKQVEILKGLEADQVILPIKEAEEKEDEKKSGE